jgi:hypothetical protein
VPPVSVKVAEVSPPAATLKKIESSGVEAFALFDTCTAFVQPDAAAMPP